MDKFTSGPWKYSSEDGREFTGSGNFYIMHPPNYETIAKIEIPIHDVPISRAAALANARLISAAPQLYESLRAACAQCGCTVKEADSGHKIGCFVPETLEILAKIDNPT